MPLKAKIVNYTFRNNEVANIVGFVLLKILSCKRDDFLVKTGKLFELKF